MGIDLYGAPEFGEQDNNSGDGTDYGAYTETELHTDEDSNYPHIDQLSLHMEYGQQQAVVVTSTSPAAPSSEICTFPYHSTCNCQPPGLMETRLVPAQQLTIVAMSVLTVEKNSQRRPNCSDIN